ncbi:MAG: FMN-binding protein [Proteobacteria bacterium]|nr:FMN-binding protein [Pseudomonadota bacterium]
MLDSDLQLTGSIDGITGATLSVKAVTNVTRFALYLHESVTVGEGVAMGAIEDD